ncbi:MAG: 4'-phosphopantetheinyl transferase superfamily protein [Phenylobacterium sp.]|jgi:4'-phosphopantetheinyl transferase EntD|uniref:4'-phosphopantetheinyl transferase family protein n=1 Tax=Phenylobacterium sp. TaxID=1871053 RepID=UPI0025F67021|nr:4'-phosphopantetheinyl transferase superfamily protein [Phenylobacterium sp.]MCA3710590.1 4'-phosphopantetheinyl transferase superfamily protein [Phenylobacterium sp.]
MSDSQAQAASRAAAAIVESLPPRVAFAGGLWRTASPPLLPGEAEGVAGALEARRVEFAIGRAFARQALAALGVAPCPIPRARSRAPVWPEGLVGSISHCDGFCGAIAARGDLYAGVGLDVDSAAPLARASRPLVCADGELDDAQSRNGLARDSAAKLIFSIKESVYKAYAQATGDFLDFLDVAVELDSPSTFLARIIAPHRRSPPGGPDLAGVFGLVPGFVFSAIGISSSSRDQEHEPKSTSMDKASRGDRPHQDAYPA